jgi:hypothetical protein
MPGVLSGANHRPVSPTTKKDQGDRRQADPLPPKLRIDINYTTMTLAMVLSLESIITSLARFA